MKIIIITLLLASSISNAQDKKVLFVMSAAKELPLKNGKTYRETGVFLNELYLAYKEIAALGYDIDFATPDGVTSSIDKESLDLKYWKGKEEVLEEAKEFVSKNPRFNNPMTLENALEKVNEYSGMIVPGGQGLMVDLINDKKMADIILSFFKERKAIGLICHAPALILSIPKEKNPFISYQINSVSGLEEFYIEKFVMKGKPQKRKIAKQLRKLGLDYKSHGPGKNYAVRDRELITSQNPFSNEAFTKLYLEVLNEYEPRKK